MENKKMVGVIDASTFGTTLAETLASKFPVRLGVNTALDGGSLLQLMIRTRENTIYLPGYRLSDNVEIMPTQDVARTCDIILVAIPSKYLRSSLEAWAGLVKPDASIVSTVKGIELETFMRPTKIIRSVMKKLGKTSLEDKTSYAVISGPTFSASMREGRRLSATLAAVDKQLAWSLKDILSVPHRLNLQISHDVKGTEYLGSLKNVIAIGAGYMAEAGYCEDEFDTYMTFAANEIANMLGLFRCNPQTIMSLAGIGDLNMTSRSDKSRNFRAGRELARSGKIDYQSKGGVVEGYNTSRAIYELFRDNRKISYAEKYFRIFIDLYHAIHGDRSPGDIKKIFDDMLSFYESGIPFRKITIIKSVQDRMMRNMIQRKYEPNGQ